jgi:glycosyltransferase involved in cell wall biosynthesis
MRILYHHRTMGDGAEGIHIKEMVAALRELGHEVRVVSLVGEQSASGSRDQRRWTNIRRLIPSAMYEFAELGYNVVGGNRVSRTIEEFRPDLVYDRYNSYCTAAVKAARRAGVPVLLEMNAPVAYERVAYENLQLKMPRLAFRYERHICAAADHVFVVSTPLKRYLVDRAGITPEKVTVLPNGADPRRFDPTVDGGAIRERHGIGDRTVIGFVGILRPWHGVEMLLDAFGQLQSEQDGLHLLIVGDGPIEADLKARARDLGLSGRVTFTGRLTHEAVRDHVAAIDIAISPRATFYACPMKILEYMAMAKPVVAPAMDNIRDILVDGKTGILFTPEDGPALTSALRRLISSSEERARLGRAARGQIETRFNWKYNAERVIEQATGLQQRPVSKAFVLRNAS